MADYFTGSCFTEISDDMAKALKKKGFKFVGTTTCYAFMQAVGMVNDHILCCFFFFFCRQSPAGKVVLNRRILV